MKNDGVTLIELLVVISIIAILAAALAYSYIGWQGSYRAEKTINELYTDLVGKRTMATTQNNNIYLDFPTATSYRMAKDDSDGANKPVSGGDGIWQKQVDPAVPTPTTDTNLPTFPKRVAYALSNNAGADIVSDKRGVTYTSAGGALPLPTGGAAPATIAICLSTTANADYDCVEISNTRIKLGKLATQISNGGACNAANCVAK